MRRLHVDDLVAHVLDKEDWVHLDLPAIADVDQTFVLSDDRHFTRFKGGILHPEREPPSVLNNIKNTISDANFSTQYLQQPIPTQKATWFGGRGSSSMIHPSKRPGG